MAVPELEAQGTLGAAAAEGRQASPLLVSGAQPLQAVSSRIAPRSDNGRLLFPAQETDQIFHGTRDRGQEEAAGTDGTPLAPCRSMLRRTDALTWVGAACRWPHARS